MPDSLRYQGGENGIAEESKISVSNLNLWYGPSQALYDISMNIKPRRVSAFIGPSGCGKSTFIRALNRMNDLIDNVRTTGRVLIDGQDIYQPGLDVVSLRRNVGMIFQKSNPFPKSVYENVAYGQRLLGVRNRGSLDDIVERSLKQAALWDEVKD
ncbi:MAG TPA: ATP-binding cassette domain-containing protein, partial [Bacteroidota bacterium]